ncbi:2'-5' RNA ligase family protein [Aminobacter sp. UC22_36]|uniref:2'-5' RNA ligase family protein n=1 Tax=Aminobacter sp. UC22_36 TaxID=3374549 RepID=UPI0037578BC3
MSLDLGLPPPRQRSDNLFFCLLAGPDDAARTTALARSLCLQHGVTGQLQAANRLHVSLCSLGKHAGLSPWLLNIATRAGGAVTAAPFELTFDRFVSFRSRDRQPLVLLCDGGKAELMALQHQLGAALGAVGLNISSRACFEPHCTLLYGRSSVPATRLEQPVTWRVRELALVHSLVGQGIYLHPGRWPLLC